MVDAMTNWDKILFIGGPADGMNLGIPVGKQEYAIAKPEHPPIFSFTEQPSPPETDYVPSGVNFVLYHRMRIRGRGKEFAMMVRCGMTADEVMERLMAYYRPPQTTEGDTT